MGPLIYIWQRQRMLTAGNNHSDWFGIVKYNNNIKIKVPLTYHTEYSTPSLYNFR